MSQEDDTDDSQKTEDPSQKKLADARKRGQVILSREINNWIMLFVGALIIGTMAPHALGEMKKLLTIFLEAPHKIPMDAHSAKEMGSDLFSEVGMIWLIPLLFLFIAAFLGPFVQIGPLFSAESMKPSLSKISIIKGVGRLFSARSVMEFLKGLLKLTVISAVGVLVMMPVYPTIEHLIFTDFNLVMEELHTLLIRLFTAVLAVLTVIAVMDYIFQYRDFMKKMRMSKQELKEEYKQTEGDPQIKARLRELRETKARQRMMAAVPEADVVITNPDHYAIALKYDAENMNAPIMIAKGVDRVALNIKDLAKEHDISVVENPPLARGLYASMEIGQMIPEEHYKAVAEVISYVFRMKGKKMN